MKLEIHEHISRLLFDHECVVVPGFGAFLTRHYAAEINPATHMMRPSSRRVHFNASIKQNDGLLAKSIGYIEQLTYNQAQDYIAQEVAKWKSGLEGGDKVVLAGIGRLYKDSTKSIQFNPSLETNYLRNSYGLSIFRSHTIEREGAIRKSIASAIELNIATDSDDSSKKPAAWVSWAAVLGPVILASAIGLSYFTANSDALDNYSGMNWFTSSRGIEKPVENAEPATIVESTVAEEAPSELPAEPKDEVEVEENVVPEVVDEPSNLRMGHFHIVVGSFKDSRNAQNYISELRSKGYEAYLAEGTASFSRVSIGNFKDEESARVALMDIKKQVHPQSWIYSN